MYKPELQRRLAQRYTSASVTQRLTDSIDPAVFEKGLAVSQREEVEEFAAIMFIDISNFSERIRDSNVSEVRDYLDTYYTTVLTAIYNVGGHVDRIAGDGILAVFSPFLTDYSNEREASCSALAAAENIVRALSGTEWACKASLSAAPVLFCATGLEAVYEEYTVIGQPITVTYRTDALAGQDQVLAQTDCWIGILIDEQVDETQQRGGTNNPTWTVRHIERELRGVGSTGITVEFYNG